MAPKRKSPYITTLPTVLIAYILLFIYNYFYRGGINDATWSESLAATAGFLIGFSFIASSVSYFLKNSYLVGVRKQLGLYGFWIALAYCFSLQYRFPEKYYYGLTNNLAESEVILGLVAMFIFGFMTLISHKIGVKLLGASWRPALRLGYIAYFLLIIRAVIVEGEIWNSWLQSFNGFPPPRLILSIFAFFVIFMRIVLEFSLRANKK